ncbi:MAG: M23 family metallopeptidase [Anaerolineae bacterium]
MIKKTLLAATLLLSALFTLAPFPISTAAKQAPFRPFGLPFAGAPGPTTWLLDQQYGNTIGAFNYGRYWYAAGQNLHFGVDFSAPCNTPVLAIGDGEIDQVDNMSFGLEPHNLTIFHRDLRLTSVYGHLNVKSTLMKGQPIKRGDVIGYSGDPDLTCISRPHLHLEVRDSSYGIAYNPAAYIDTDWDMLATIGYHTYGGFVKDLTAANRWQNVINQPDIDFNEAPLNAFALSWPPLARNQPSPYTRPAFTAAPLGTNRQIVTLTRSGCCTLAWWSPDSQSARFWDGPDGQLAQIFSINILGGDPQPFDGYPLQMRSPDDQYRLELRDGQMSITRMVDGTVTPLATGGAWAQFSPNVSHLLWHRHPADDIPGGIPPATEVWISDLDGSNRVLVQVQQGGLVYWLDEDRILLAEPIARTNRYKLSIYTISTRSSAVMLPQVGHMRGLAVAPGGKFVLFYAPFQEDPNVSGIYLIETVPNATANKLAIFGSYRWRDSNSFYYVPLALGQSMQLQMYDISTGQSTIVTDPAQQPISIANDDWSVSPDGNAILYWEGSDYTLRALNLR